MATYKCSGASARVAVANFGKNFVKNAQMEIISQFTPEMLAEVETAVVDRAPDSLLDLAMEKRLNTIRARSLLNMLARAERLGFNENDIVDDVPGRGPRNLGVPNSTSSQLREMPAARPPPQHQASGRSTDPLTCPFCLRRYVSQMARDHVSIGPFLRTPFMHAPD